MHTQNTTSPTGHTPYKGKRLLVVSQHFWPEAFRITDIVEGFLEDGIQVDVLCGLPNYPKGEWFEGYRYTGPRRQNYKGAEVFRSGEIRRKGNTSVRIFLNYISFPVFSLFSLPRLAGRKYDAVFCYETSPVMMMLPAILYAKLHRVPLTTYVLDLWPDNLYSVLPVKSPFLRKVAQGVSSWHYRRSTRLISMSDKLAEQLHSIIKGKPIDIAVIPQYCEDFYARAVSPQEWPIEPSDSFTILFAGNLSPAQDIENLVDAVKLVVEEHKLPLRCLIVGDGMSRDSLEEYVKKTDMQDTIVFCGSYPPEEIPCWAAAADALFAGLSKSANLGLTVPAKLTSYFAAAKPLLIAADGEMARAAAESGAALVSAAGDASALAQNIASLLSMSKQEQAAMGAAGRTAYQTQYKRSILLEELKKFIFQG